MLGRMILHAAAATAIVASAAAVYAGTRPGDAPVANPPPSASAPATAEAGKQRDNGYLQPSDGAQLRGDEDAGRPAHRDGHRRHERSHDDDDD